MGSEFFRLPGPLVDSIGFQTLLPQRAVSGTVTVPELSGYQPNPLTAKLGDHEGMQIEVQQLYPCIHHCIHIHALHTYIHTCIHAYMHTYIHAYIPTYPPTYLPTYIRTDIHYMCIYICIYIHVYMHACLSTCTWHHVHCNGTYTRPEQRIKTTFTARPRLPIPPPEPTKRTVLEASSFVKRGPDSSQVLAADEVHLAQAHMRSRLS